MFFAENERGVNADRVQIKTVFMSMNRTGLVTRSLLTNNRRNYI